MVLVDMFTDLQLYNAITCLISKTGEINLSIRKVNEVDNYSTNPTGFHVLIFD